MLDLRLKVLFFTCQTNSFPSKSSEPMCHYAIQMYYTIPFSHHAPARPLSKCECANAWQCANSFEQTLNVCVTISHPAAANTKTKNYSASVTSTSFAVPVACRSVRVVSLMRVARKASRARVDIKKERTIGAERGVGSKGKTLLQSLSQK